MVSLPLCQFAYPLQAQKMVLPRLLGVILISVYCDHLCFVYMYLLFIALLFPNLYQNIASTIYKLSCMMY